MKIKQVRPCAARQLRTARATTAAFARFLLDLREGEVGRCGARTADRTALERFIGVIYRPETERWSHYREAMLPRQFDAWVWFDETSAVTPLPGKQRPGGHVAADDTYPFGL